MLDSDLLPEFGCDSELIEIPERGLPLVTGHLFKIAVPKGCRSRFPVWES